MSNYYCTEEDVRMALHLKQDRADDEELRYWINESQLELLRDISFSIKDEKVSGNIDGSNTTFSVGYTPIADTDFDKLVGSTDVFVYGWTDESEPSSKVALTVSTIYVDYGTIVLSSAPSSTYEKITMDYRYYPNTINFDLASRATRQLAAYKFIFAKYLLIPERLAHGPIRFTFGRPYERLYKEYQRLVHLMITKPYVIQKREANKLMRSQY